MIPKHERKRKKTHYLVIVFFTEVSTWFIKSLPELLIFMCIFNPQHTRTGNGINEFFFKKTTTETSVWCWLPSLCLWHGQCANVSAPPSPVHPPPLSTSPNTPTGSSFGRGPWLETGFKCKWSHVNPTHTMCVVQWRVVLWFLWLKNNEKFLWGFFLFVLFLCFFSFCSPWPFWLFTVLQFLVLHIGWFLFSTP